MSGPQLPVLRVASACASDNDGNRYFAALKQQEGGAINREEEGGGKDASAGGVGGGLEEEQQQQPFPEEKTPRAALFSPSASHFCFSRAELGASASSIRNVIFIPDV